MIDAAAGAFLPRCWRVSGHAARQIWFLSTSTDGLLLKSSTPNNELCIRRVLGMVLGLVSYKHRALSLIV